MRGKGKLCERAQDIANPQTARAAIRPGPAHWHTVVGEVERIGESASAGVHAVALALSVAAAREAHIANLNLGDVHLCLCRSLRGVAAVRAGGRGSRSSCSGARTELDDCAGAHGRVREY